MSEESTTPDLVELLRGSLDAFARRDLDATMSVYGPDSVWDTSPAGMGTFEGPAAIRGFFEDWIAAYEEFEIDAEEILGLGNGVTFAIFIQRGRLVGSSGEVRVRSASVAVWVGGLLVRVTNYPDIDQARAAAERLAESRGQAMSRENVEIVRRAWDAWHRGDIDGVLALCSEHLVFDTAHIRDWPEPEYVGHAGFRRFLAEWLEVWDAFEVGVDEFAATADGLVVVLFWQRGKGRQSGLGMDVKWAQIVTIRDGKALKLEMYDSREQTLKAVGLAE